MARSNPNLHIHIVTDSNMKQAEHVPANSDAAVVEKTSKPSSPLGEVYDTSLYPSRLQPLIPPPNFGAVQGGQIFRSAFPQTRNLDFIEQLNVKTVLCLVSTEPSEECMDYVRVNDIKRARIDIAPNKDGKVSSTLQSIFDALLLVMDASNWPLYIHCNQGRHRTGCVIACLRKMQQWPMDAIIEEYKAYASPKARDGDVQFIRDVFQPELMLEYVKQYAQFEHRPTLMQLLRSDLVEVDVEKFVDILASMDGVVPVKDSLKSNTSSHADSAIEICPTIPEESAEILADHGFEVSVEECGPLSPPIAAETTIATALETRTVVVDR